MELHTKDCLLQPQKCQYCFIGCTFEGSESEVTKHEREANQEHFDILVKHVEEVDLKCIQLETQLEMCRAEHVRERQQKERERERERERGREREREGEKVGEKLPQVRKRKS
ncbi:hypothetical protein LSAT2_023097 [Lamellibrachia satsuma]|nr:hypothetical protein LSAT2_023097 [Lamellibrachia satsuma]